MGVDCVGACAAERVFIEPYGIPHKRVDGYPIPPFVQASAIVALRETWKPRKENTFVVVPQEYGPPEMDALGLLIALAEQWRSDTIKPLSSILNTSHHFSPSDIMKVSVAGGEFPTPEHPLIDRVLECRAACGQESADRRCLITRLPPSLMPASSLQGSGGGHESWADVGAGEESECSAPAGGEKVVVICADPRFLVMKEYLSVKRFHDLRQMETGCSEPLEVARFLELGLQAPLIQSLKSLTEWAREEQRRPSQVRLLFIEEFVSEPDVALLGLARFLGVQEGSDVLQTVLQEIGELVQQSRGLFARCPEGVSEIQFVRGLAQQFEGQLDAVPLGVAQAWAEQVSELMRIQSPRVLSLGQALQAHTQLQLPAWWAVHSAGLCRPCTFASRGTCRNLETCAFCHGPHGPRVSKRPSKKWRERRERQRQAARVRTPSPEGLSS